jgi:cell division topological specificity factor
MASIFDRVFGRGAGRSRGSGSKAKERLQFVLVHDRINLPPEQMEAMKHEILAVISKYVQVDARNVEIALQQRDRDSLLVAEIPFARRHEGIEPDDPEYLPPRHSRNGNGPR